MRDHRARCGLYGFFCCAFFWDSEPSSLNTMARLQTLQAFAKGSLPLDTSAYNCIINALAEGPQAQDP